MNLASERTQGLSKTTSSDNVTTGNVLRRPQAGRLGSVLRELSSPALLSMMGRRSLVAAALGALIGTLGGLIGLGGGEFRLPVLLALFGYAARAAVPMNLLISLITLAASLAIRAKTLSLTAVGAHAIETVALAVGGMVGAAWSARLLTRQSDPRLERIVTMLLAAIGVVLIVEAFFPPATAGLIPRDPTLLSLSAVSLGVAIGVVAALLGVAGGELLIPTLLIVYGADIRTAGTASLMISFVTVTSGVLRYRKLGALPSRDAIHLVAVPMGLGSIVGAVIGGLIVGWISPSVLKVVLGSVLIAAATKNQWAPRPEHVSQG